jgi:PAS domain S-box-containing protein
MKRPNREKILRLATATILPVIAAVLQQVFWSTIQPSKYLLFYPAVFLASWIGGLSGGLVATFLSAVIVQFLFAPPYFSFEIKDPAILLSVGVFTVMGVLFSVVHERLKRTTARTSEKRYQGTLDTLMEGCQIIDREWHYVYVNEAAATQGQSTREALIGKTMMEVYPGIEKTPLFDILRRCQEKHVSERIENKFNLPDGGVGYFELSVQPVPEGIVILSVDITERKRTEEALHQSEEKYRLIADNADDWVYWIAPDGNLRYISPSCERVTGYSPAEFIANPELIEAIVHTEDKESAEHLSEKVLDKIDSDRLEFRIITKSGETRWISHTCSPIYNIDGEYVGRRATNRNITERKRAEAAVRESEEQFRTMANAMSQLAWIAKADGYIYWYNRRWYEYTGTTPEQMEGWGWQSVHDPAVLPQVMENWTNAIASEKPFDMEFPLRGADGRFRIFLTRVQPLRDTSGQIVQWFGTNTDVDMLKRAEEKIHQLNAELEDRVAERTAQLEAANKELEAFSYSVSHDLRAPLRHASGYVDLLVKRFNPDLPEKAQHYLTAIADSVHQMGMLIDDLLQFSRTGRTELRRSNSDMNAILKEVLESVRHDTVGRTIEWIVPNLPPTFCDGAMLKLVWTNLLSNAVKFSRTRRNTRIEIGSRQEKTESVFFVRDNGVGFDMQYAHKLFGVFQRLHSTDEFEGTGIGLANVRRIISRHEGRTWAEAELDKGATFYFTLPHHTQE